MSETNTSVVSVVNLNFQFIFIYITSVRIYNSSLIQNPVITRERKQLNSSRFFSEQEVCAPNSSPPRSKSCSASVWLSSVSAWQVRADFWWAKHWALVTCWWLFRENKFNDHLSTVLIRCSYTNNYHIYWTCHIRGHWEAPRGHLGVKSAILLMATVIDWSRQPSDHTFNWNLETTSMFWSAINNQYSAVTGAF